MLNLLRIKPSFTLPEYLTNFKRAVEMVLPTKLPEDPMPNSKFDIFNNANPQELNLLAGHAIIVPKGDLKVMNYQDDIIISLDYQVDSNLLSSTPDERFAKLFEIKTKFTREELQVYMQDFLEGEELDKFLLRNAKISKEQHPFDEGQMIMYYLKKF